MFQIRECSRGVALVLTFEDWSAVLSFGFDYHLAFFWLHDDLLGLFLQS